MKRQLDHILLSPLLVPRKCGTVVMLAPLSDHAPVTCGFELPKKRRYTHKVDKGANKDDMNNNTQAYNWSLLDPKLLNDAVEKAMVTRNPMDRAEFETMVRGCALCGRGRHEETAEGTAEMEIGATRCSD